MGMKRKKLREPKVAAVRQERRQPVPRKRKWRNLDRRQTPEASANDWRKGAE